MVAVKHFTPPSGSITNTKVNSAFYPFRVDKSSSGLSG